MNLAAALHALAGAAKRLKPEQGRIARRNARQAVMTALRLVRGAVNRDFPRIAKPKPPPPPKPEKPPKPPPFEPIKLPFNKRWQLSDAKLFALLAASAFGVDAPEIKGHTHAADVVRRRANCAGDCPRYEGKAAWLRAEWPDSLKWRHVIHALAHLLANERTWQQMCQPVVLDQRLDHHVDLSLRHCEYAVLDLWAKFWTELLPGSDLQLAAEHQAWLEKRAKSR